MNNGEQRSGLRLVSHTIKGNYDSLMAIGFFYLGGNLGGSTHALQQIKTLNAHTPFYQFQKEFNIGFVRYEENLKNTYSYQINYFPGSNI